MKLKLTIDIPTETIVNYQKESLNFVNLLRTMKNLEQFIKSVIEDQTTWEIENITLIDKQEFKKLQEYFQSFK